MNLTLSPYIGTGTIRNPYRPIIEGASIDLRPDCTRRDGFALVSTEEKVRFKISEDFRDTFGVRIRNRVHNKLGVDISRVRRFDVLAAKLLLQPNGWKPLRPTRWQYEIWLGGLVWTFPLLQGGASDTFTYSDGELSSVSGNIWKNHPNSESTLSIVSNAVKITTDDLQTAYYYDGAAVTTEQYSQCVNPSDGFTAGGPAVRIGGFTGFSLYLYWPAFDQPLKYVNNSFSAVGPGLSPSYNATEVMRIQVQGSSIACFIQGVELSGSPSTDTSIAGAGNGVGIAMDESASVVDNWEGGDIIPPSAPPISRQYKAQHPKPILRSPIRRK